MELNIAKLAINYTKWLPNTRWCVVKNSTGELHELLLVIDVIGDEVWLRNDITKAIVKRNVDELKAVELGIVFIGTDVVRYPKHDLFLTQYITNKLTCSSIILIDDGLTTMISTLSLDEIFIKFNNVNPDPKVANHKFKILLNELFQM